MKQIIDIADLDVIFLTFDEPKADENWIRIQQIVPWAKRVDGVKGSDAAHKAAASASTTDRFILIDGDNMPYPSFFSQQLVLDDTNRDCVFRWKARNAINGLCYGNGGLSCWTKEFVQNMKTHEAADGAFPESEVEFCWEPNYWAMHDCYSTTNPNGDEFQAWRSGFREGVKLCLDRGVKPTLEEFEKRVHPRNYENLSIWHNVGRDVMYGDWAISGARMGTWATMLTTWDYRLVHDFMEIKALWDLHRDARFHSATVDAALRFKLGLDIVVMDAIQSSFFKRHTPIYQNKGIMVRE